MPKFQRSAGFWVHDQVGLPDLACSLLVGAIYNVAVAQQTPPDVPSSSDETLSEQQWRQRVEDARAKSAEFVARAKAGTIESLSSDDEDKKVADQRAMNDPSLRAGDIVSTSKGFLVFQGSKDDAH
jgi:hypothetical protein